MPEHYTRNTVTHSRWCGACKTNTPHRVDGVKRGPCLVCMGEVKIETLDLKSNTVPWPMPCFCSKFPFAHYHEEFLKRWDESQLKGGLSA